MTTWNSRVFVCLKFRPVSWWPVETLIPPSNWGEPAWAGWRAAPTFPSWDLSGTHSPQASPAGKQLTSTQICPLLGNSSSSPPWLPSLKRRRSMVSTASREALYTSCGCLWKANCNRKAVKARRDFFIFAGPSQNIGSQCSTGSFKVISHADVNVVIRAERCHNDFLSNGCLTIYLCTLSNTDMVGS